MTVNRKEIARRIAYRQGFSIGAVEEVLEAYEDIVAEAVESGETVKHGKLYKLYLHYFPEKRAWDGLNKVYFQREPKFVPKFKPMKRITDIEIKKEKEDEEKE